MPSEREIVAFGLGMVVASIIGQLMDAMGASAKAGLAAVGLIGVILALGEWYHEIYRDW
jgi:uncharacterized membrane protein